MRQRRGQIILPDKPLRRFRLPEIPDEVGAAPPPSRATPRVVVFAGWCVLSALCFWGAEGVLAPSALASWVTTRLAHSESAARPVAARAPRAEGKAAPAASAAAPVAKPPPPRRVQFVSLPEVGRAAPAVHGGSTQSSYAYAEPSRDEGVTLERALRERDERDQPFGLRAGGAVDAAEMPANLAARGPTPPPAQPQPSPPPLGAAKRPEASAKLAAPPLKPAAPQPFEFTPPAPPAPKPPAAELPEPRPREPERPPQQDERPAVATAGLSCEAARARHEETIDVSAGNGVPDVDRGAYGRILEDFDRYSGCGLDRQIDVSICVAVLDGAAKGVTVKTQPGNARIAACIARAVRRISFPRSPRMDVVRTELIVR